MLDFMRLGCAVPPVQVGNVPKNVQDTCAYMAQADAAGCDLLLFPELSLTGYTCGDLFFQEALQTATLEGLSQIVKTSSDYPALTVVVGLPVCVTGQVYNCAAVVGRGKLWGIIPKTFLPNYGEFYERRWFASSQDLPVKEVPIADLGTVPIGRDLLFTLGDGTVLGVEVCEDLWAPMPPSTMMRLNGAEVIVNLSASNELVGKRAYRQNLVTHQSAVCSCVYALCSSGSTESTQDLVMSGHSLIAQDGKLICENKDLIASDYLLVQDVDLGTVRARRRHNTSIRDAISIYSQIQPMRRIDCSCSPLRSDGTLYKYEKMPFVPEDPQVLADRCEDIFRIQVAGLKQRLATIGANAVLGISGGLDSTLALLVAVQAMKELGRPATDVYGVTMPCFGTSDRTYQNAWELMKKLGISTKEISIKDAVLGHFKDIGHDVSIRNGTYENAQARERTQILMDYASVVGGLVIGTGDLSELALGWCTYNGDHMSMYSVNGSVPKTLIGHLILHIAKKEGFTQAADVLRDIVDTPISPELLPPDEKGKISQQTEDLVGPYALHDFFLYYVIRFGYAPKKVYTLACRVYEGQYDAATVKKWLTVFYRRFFSQQFKRNCLPDGVKVGSVSVSPRGDWRMPSDATAKVWLAELENL